MRKRSFLVTVSALMAGLLFTVLALSTLPTAARQPTPLPILDIPFINQYDPDNLNANVSNCGPAAVAMVLEAYNKRPGGRRPYQAPPQQPLPTFNYAYGHDYAFVKQIRETMVYTDSNGIFHNKASGDADTDFLDLAYALYSFGLQSSPTTGTAEEQLPLIAEAIKQQRPVIALLNGPVLGRPNHWIVIRGFSDELFNEQTKVYVNDPDLRTYADQNGLVSGWKVPAGENKQWDYQLLKSALIGALIVDPPLPVASPPPTPPNTDPSVCPPFTNGSTTPDPRACSPQFSPGDTVTDPLNDQPIAYIDADTINTQLEGEVLTATIQLREAPISLFINQVRGLESARYSWQIYIDVDNNQATGYPTEPYRGSDYKLLAVPNLRPWGCVGPGQCPSRKYFITYIQQSDSTGNWIDLPTGNADFDPTSGALIISGTIPGITPQSRLFFESSGNDTNGQPQRDIISCDQDATQLPTTNVSVALIIDSSLSMEDNDPQEQRKAAAQFFIDLAQPGDQIAVIDFDSGARSLAPLTAISTPQSRNDLKATVDLVDSSGNTSLSAGLLEGFQRLAEDSSSARKAAIFLTDGQGYYNDEARNFADQGWPIYVIGLGEGVDPVLLEHIAQTTGGAYYPTPDNQTLQEIYRALSNQLQSQAANSVMIRISPQESRVFTSIIPRCVPQVTFGVSWSDSTIVMRLISPSGLVINSSTSSPGVYYTRDDTYEIYRIDNPEAGQWIIEVTALDALPDGSEINLSVSHIPITSTLNLSILAPQTVSYADPFSATITAASPAHPGSAIQFTASGLPDGLSLVSQGDGTAVVTGIVQAPAGIYPFEVAVTTPDGLTVTQTLSVTVRKRLISLLYTGDTSGTPGLPVTLSAQVEAGGSPDADLTKATVFFDLKAYDASPAFSYGPAAVTANGEATWNSPNGIPAGAYKLIVRVDPDNPYYQTTPDFISIPPTP